MGDEQPRKSITGVTLLITGAVCLVIVTIVYNAIAEKRAYEAAQQTAAVAPAAASAASAASAPQ